MALVAIVGLAAAGGWIVLRGHSGEPTTTDRRGYLPTDPQQRYSVTLSDSVDDVVEAVGTPGRVALKVGSGASSHVLVLDAEGTEQWRREIEYWDTIEIVDDDVLLTSRLDDEDDSLEMTRLDGDTGDELWSTVVPGADQAGVSAHSLRDSTVLERYVVGVGTESRIMIAAYDIATGEQIAERQLFRALNGLGVAVGSIVVIEDDELFVVDDRLENIGPGIPLESLGDTGALALLDGEVLTIDGQQLTLYGVDGAVSSAAIDIEGISHLEGIADSSWLYHTTADSCGAFRFDGSDVKPLWQHSQDCDPFLGSLVVPYDGGAPLAFPSYNYSSDDDGILVLNALTGETVFSGSEPWVIPYFNGFVTQRLGDLTAYAWPGGEEMFAISSTRNRLAQLIDDGYVVIDGYDGDGFRITVYG